MKTADIFRKIVTEASLYESRYGLKPNTVILGVEIYNFVRGHFEIYVYNELFEFTPKQLMGMDVSIDYDRKHIIGVSCVTDYSDLFNENNNLGD